MEAKFSMVAKTFQGLEDVLGDELIALGAENVEIGRRMVAFEGDLAILYKANLCCRTALRILKPIIKFTASNPDELYDAVRDVEWEKYLTPDSTFSIESTVNSTEFPHSKYVVYRVKDGIVDHFSDRVGSRPSVRVKGADMIFNVHISDNRVTISLDSSGEPLSYRGYRTEQTAAPINEALAAGIILKTGWHGETDFADPMCGSGTFLIEAALIAANINPGIYRENFAFEKWPDFDADLFEEIYNDDSEEREFHHKIYGGDIDPEAVSIARRNIASARVDDMIEISCRSMGEWTDMADEGTLVMNPPYGERLRPDDMETLYRNIGKWLKTEFQGWNAWVLGYRDEHFDAIHLKPTVKYPILNGALECSLREYVLFAGRYDDLRAGGGDIGKSERQAVADHARAKHLSDREWREETHRYGAQPNRKFRDRDDSRSDDRKYDGRKRDDRKRDDRKRDDRKRDDRKRDDRKRDEGAGIAARRYSSAKEPRQIHDKGPRLSEDTAYRFSDAKMRGRKKK